MISKVRLSECEGAARFGDCIVCSRRSKYDKTLYRFTFMGETHNSGTTVVLCEKHIRELKHRVDKALLELEDE